MAERRTTIADVAREAGVSKGLVSFALNDRPGVAPDTRRRILGVAAELGWNPSLRARSLSTARSFALGLVIARDPAIIAGDPFFPAFISGIESVLGPIGQSLVLSMVADDRAEAASYRRLVENDRVDGVILTDLRGADPRVALLTELGLPAVTLGHPDIPSPFAAASLDEESGVRAAVAHLVGLGHRRIAHVAGPGRMLHGARRREAFAAELRERGLEGDLVIEADFSAASGARATRELLARAEAPTAIVYANDPMAIAGLGQAQKLGRRVPGDLSVVGFDGSEVGEQMNPSLTTVAPSVAEWGSQSAALLLRVIAGADVGDVTLPPARLVIRDSTSPPSLAARE